MQAKIKIFVAFSIILTFLASFVVISNAGSINYIEANGVKLVDYGSDQVKGKVSLSGETTKNLIKVLIVKDSNQTWNDIELSNGTFNTELWLTDGSGIYEIYIMVHEDGRKYSFGPKLTVNNVAEVNKFLVPGKYVESDNYEIINLAKKITVNDKTDMEKAKSIYNWVSQNIKYDTKKYRRQLAKNFDNNYGAVYTLKTRSGVCYDYSTLVAALGRSLGLQVKVVKGNFTTPNRQEYHAWNEIFVSEENRWVKMDTTFGYAFDKNYFDNSDFDSEHVKLEEN